MSTALDDLTERAASLPPDQRFTLAHRILSTIEPPVTDAVEKAWDSEIRQRIEKFQKGLSKSIPAEQVFAEIDAALEE